MEGFRGLGRATQFGGGGGPGGETPKALYS